MKKQWPLIVLATILCSLTADTSNAVQKRGVSDSVSRKSRAPELGSIEQLRDAFQNDQGKVRLVALLSPT